MTETPVATVNPEAAALRALDAELAKRQEIIASSAASMIDPERMRGVVLSAFTRNPELWECDPVTVVRAVVEAAQVGLEPTGAIGGAHLVPRWNSKRRVKEAQLTIDYRGLAMLARRSGEVARITARAVREKDDFDYQQGTEEWLRHKPFLDGDPGPYTHFYAIAHFRDGGAQFVVMSAAQVLAHRDRFAPRNKDRQVVGPWATDYEEMAKKTALRNLAKLLPLTVEVRAAIAFEDEQTHEAPVAPARPSQSARLRGALQARLTGGEPADEPEAEPEFDPAASAAIDAAEAEAQG